MGSLRGGGFRNNAVNARASNRIEGYSGNRNDNVGVRLSEYSFGPGGSVSRNGAQCRRCLNLLAWLGAIETKRKSSRRGE